MIIFFLGIILADHYIKGMYLDRKQVERKDIIKTNWVNTVRNYLRTHLSVMIFLLALILALTNYIVYPAFLNQRFDLVEVAIVSKLIQPNTKIMKEDIAYVTFPIEALPANIYVNKNEIIDKFTNEKMTLVKGSFFYKEMLVENLLSSEKISAKLAENEFAYSVIIDQESGLKGMLDQGEHVDLFFQSNEKSNEGKMIIGKLMEHLRIIDIIRDDNNKTEQLILAIKEEDIDYMIAAKSFGIIFPYVSWQSAITDHKVTNVYDIQATRQLIEMRIYDLKYFESFIEAQES